MAFAFIYRTRFGTFAIVPRGERWHAMLGKQDLGSYHRPEAALDDLVGGHTFSPSPAVDTSEAGLPDDLSEWERQPI